MTWRGMAFLLPFIGVLICQFLIYVQDPNESLEKLNIRLAGIPGKVHVYRFKPKPSTDMVPIIATVACGNDTRRLEELKVMLKSALIKSDGHPVKFLIVMDSLHEEVKAILSNWTRIPKYSAMTWDITSPEYPVLSKEAETIKTAFAPCATQRLFFPQILADYQRVIYVDNDIIFLQDPSLLWKVFEHLETDKNASLGLVSEHNVPRYSAYNYSKLPKPGNGLNSGVILMQLDRLRKNNWHSKMIAIYEEMKDYMPFCDQDLLNIYTHFYKQELFQLPVSANVRPDFCLDITSMSLSVIANGPVLHGSRGCFHKASPLTGIARIMRWLLFSNIRLVEYLFHSRLVMNQQEVFQATFNAFKDYDMRLGIENLRNDLKHRFESIPSSDLCYKMKSVIIKHV